LPYYHGDYVTFGLSDHCTYVAKNIIYNTLGHAEFDVYKEELLLSKIKLRIPGQHHIYNALASFAVGAHYSEDYDMIADRLSTFLNADRRFQIKGTYKNALIIDDYAHHPKEIKANLEAAKRIEHYNKTICIFQPHTYSRTKALFHDFKSAFEDADEILILDIYAAREKDPGDIHSKDLCKALISEGLKAKYYENFNAVESYLESVATASTLIITMGAGDVFKIGESLINKCV